MKLEIEIDELEYEAYQTEEKIMDVDSKIKDIEKKWESEERLAVLDVDASRYDEFTKCFMMASWFANKDEERPSFNYVDISEDDLVALDGCKLIKIKCSPMPVEVKNKLIKWDVRANWIEHITQHKDGVYNIRQKANEILEAAKEDIEHTIKTTSESFCKDFDVIFHREHAGMQIMKMRFSDIEVGIDERNLKLALDCMKGKEFNVGAFSNIGPILFENERISIIVMPARIL